MLDIKEMRRDPERVAKAVGRRGKEIDMKPFLEADEKRRQIIAKVEELQAQRNAKSKEVGQLKRNGENADALMAEVSAIKAEIEKLEASKEEVDTFVTNFVASIPNMPKDDIPDGGEDDYHVERTWGTPREFAFEPKAHWELGEALDILDFNRAAKVTGSRFVFYKGLAARLERAVIAFMIDMHTDKHGYTELIPPYMTNSTSDFGTGQLPKFAEDMFHLENTDYYLIPTAEVPVTNIVRDVILNQDQIPQKLTAYTPCFRREAGSYGKDVRGLNRLHQFDKVEIVRVEKPENSYAALDEMVAHVESIVNKLGLKYRILRLCGGDMSFTSAITYDFELWSAAQQRWLEISSVSNFESYQSNRLHLRYRDEEGKIQLAHTLNGSSLALPRVVAALLEDNQTPEGIVIPEVLRPYTGFDIIK